MEKETRAGVKGWSVPNAPPPAPDQYAQFNDSGPLPVANAPTHALCRIMMPYAPATNSPTPNSKSMPRRLIPKTEEGESEATLGQCGSEGRRIGALLAAHFSWQPGLWSSWRAGQGNCYSDHKAHGGGI